MIKNNPGLALINQKMPVLKGCTLQEVSLVFLLVYVSSFSVLSILSSLLLGTIIPVLLLNIAPAILITWIILNFVGRLKVGKPLGYAQIKINLWLAKAGFKKNPYLTESRAWSIGRYE